MSIQIKPSVTNPTIANIYKEIKSGNLNISPDFQRRFVWTQEHQEKFIDSILNGFPFPEIYICSDNINVELLSTTNQVIDGQQRLTTIVNYIENRISNLRTIKKYIDLTEEEKKQFLKYELVVRNIGDVSKEVIREIFKRINLTKFKLEDVEIHNAIYDGKLISLAKELADEIDIKKYDVFYDSEITRMVDIHFFLLILATLEVGTYFNRDSEVERIIVDNNEEYKNKELRKGQILSAFNILDSLKLPLDSIWFRKSNFFTIIIELAKNNLITKDLKINLFKIEEMIIRDKGNTDSKYGEYYGFMYSGTNNRNSRMNRAKLLKLFIEKENSN